MSTPFDRDAKEGTGRMLRTKAGIQLCFYHSIMDWHHPDYLPRRTWKQTDLLQEQILIVM